MERQAKRIKRDMFQARRGDDAGPHAQPESLVAVSRFHGSRLAFTISTIRTSKTQ
ncbi:hypothetical protein Lalb_Chr14g0367621 [Lupinus albus]|uniref:Uncharacterized protein n=1 Tax=Lupinus albus TaxID=3870 RepID=A0A6A4PDM4_LUPAL|nr:hypothetical protein Lalb_Chr14g0367611 [Lupinus albus]KAE9599934.1 hypothetical protein Lalb_Chr14g0367621 [Lupinus albus]